MSQFRGWKFGGNLTDAQADQLEPMVDVMTEMLQQALGLPAHWLQQHTQHDIALALVEGTGKAASTINEISMMLLTQKNPDEQLLQLNQMATQLRQHWITVAVMAILAVNNLDKQLKGEDDAS